MVDLLVTYMEMTEAPVGEPFPAPAPDARVSREHPDRPDYLTLYRAIGEPLQWDHRLRMPSDELQALLGDRATHVYVLRVDGQVAGLCEFIGIGGADVELTNFGLIPQFQGRRLGPYLLDCSLRLIWSLAPSRVWLHTDTNDHTSAQSTYRRAGFKPYMQRVESFPD
ncbi:GNAT family N-acetyltransferase [Aminobacter anthyllidis]|uniref:GNAT family N-acetyltransferase n=1 Tax=Aminobacter anthyllidis TaxID=1035067 RepID=A0A9X1A6Z9_9HYPH|nr:GNAT family N-acetyltransferase [Aminobacter anthyllidis]MBT1154226.1 GNAT family N-acetyltransferase [Aminobacter anthyllidis]